MTCRRSAAHICGLVLVVMTARVDGFQSFAPSGGLSPSVPTQEFEIRLGEPQEVPNPGLDYFWNYPDGHLTLEPMDDTLRVIWAGSTSYDSYGKELGALKVEGPLLGAGERGSLDNGGAWIYGFYNLPGRIPADQRGRWNAIAFVHAEDHEFADAPDSTFIAWKTVALALSSDGGKTWEKQGKIIVSPREKPGKPTWGGAGDFGIVFEPRQKRWYCFYAEHYLYVAISDDPLARPGTWKKYFRGAFSEPGRGGRHTPIPSLRDDPGGNPSVHFNHDLQQWVMVWQSWDSHPTHKLCVLIATSTDLLNWSKPRLLLQEENGAAIRYPTITGASDKELRGQGLLHYARYDDFNVGNRTYLVRPIQLRWKN